MRGLGLGIIGLCASAAALGDPPHVREGVVEDIAGKEEDVADRLLRNTKSGIERDQEKIDDETSPGGGWPDVLEKHVSRGGDFTPRGQLLRSAWSGDEVSRAAVAKMAMAGLVPCGGVAPRTGEELAENVVDLAEYLVDASSSPTASAASQAKFMLLTEGMGDMDSTCGYTPNTLLALAGVRPSLCRHWWHEVKYGVPIKEGTCNTGDACKCREPTFNREYVVRAGSDGTPEPTTWWDSKWALTGRVKSPMRSQHNFLAMMSSGPWVVVPGGKGKLDKGKHVPRRGDLFFFHDSSNLRDAGHVGVVHTMTDDAPQATEFKDWRYTMKSIDSGQTCPGPSKSGWPTKGPTRKTFSTSGWQCLLGPTERKFTPEKLGPAYGLITRSSSTRRLTGFISVRDYVDRENAITTEQRFDPTLRWCTPKFLARVRGGEFNAKKGEAAKVVATDNDKGDPVPNKQDVDNGDEPEVKKPQV